MVCSPVKLTKTDLHSIMINCHSRKQSLHSKKSSWLMWSFTLCITMNSKFRPSSLPGAVMVKSTHHLRPRKELMGGVCDMVAECSLEGFSD